MRPPHGYIPWPAPLQLPDKSGASDCAASSGTTRVITSARKAPTIVTPLILFLLVLEHILQSKLHDPRLSRSTNLTKGIDVVQSGTGIQWPEAVCKVVCFSSHFQSVTFPDLECSRQCRV